MPRAYLPVAKRLLVTERAKRRCEYCGSLADYATESFTVEHILPLSRGGSDALDNLALACVGCNAHKANRVAAPDPISGEAVPLFNPRSDSWTRHFQWGEGATHLIGLTPTGRATVVALRLNRPGLVRLRHVLYEAGLHPSGPSEEPHQDDAATDP